MASSFGKAYIRNEKMEKILRAARKSREAVVAVGIFGPKGEKPKRVKGKEPSELTVLEVATMNEYGRGRPARPVIRPTIQKNKAKVKTMMRDGTRKMIANPSFTFDKTVKIIGAFLEGEIKKKVSDGVAPANAESTIRRKGSSKPRVDTGQEKSSWTHKVFPNKEAIR